MAKRMVFQGIAALGSLLFVVFFFNTKPSNSLERIQLLTIYEAQEPTKEIESTSQPPQIPNPVPKIEPTPQPLQCPDPIPIAVERVDEVDVTLTPAMQQVIDEERKKIRGEMEGYRYPNGKYDTSASKLEDLVIEENGRPVRSVILSTWRSGSTFLGDLINAHPGNYYHYEPLADFYIVQIRGHPQAPKALRRVRAMFDCDYTDQNEMIEFGKGHPFIFDLNTELREPCAKNKDFCSNHRFLSSMCKLFPFQSMKLTRLRLNIAQELLADEKSAVRMILLVRDPRGTLRSRKPLAWCGPHRDCSDPSLLCADLVSDYKIAVKLLKKYPNRFKVMRYEDLAVEPDQRVKEVCEFYGLDYHENIKKFLDTHTKYDKGDVSSTFRNSATAPFRWRTELGFEEVEEIQETCALAMKYWGYLPAMNATHQKEFNPVTNYVLN